MRIRRFEYLDRIKQEIICQVQFRSTSALSVLLLLYIQTQIVFFLIAHSNFVTEGGLFHRHGIKIVRNLSLVVYCTYFGAVVSFDWFLIEKFVIYQIKVVVLILKWGAGFTRTTDTRIWLRKKSKVHSNVEIFSYNELLDFVWFLAFYYRKMSAKKVIVYGGCGALGSACVNKFKSLNWVRRAKF